MLIFVGLSSAHNAKAVAHESRSAETERGVRFVFAALEDSREHLKSGIFRVTGYLEDQTQEPAVKGESTIFRAFDFGNGLLRFDRLEPVRVIDDSEARGVNRAGQARSRELAYVGGRFARSGDQSIEWTHGSPFAAIRPAQEKASTPVRPFDVRLVGLVNRFTLENGATWGTTVRALESRASAFARESTSLYRITWISTKSGVKIDRWFDATQGFAPVRYERRGRSVKTAGDWGKPREIGHASWTKVDDTWVPKTLTEEITYSTGSERRELAFHWEQVNGSVNRALFKWQGMGLPSGTQLFDRRLGPSIRLGTVGEDFLTAEDLKSNGARLARLVVAVCTVAVLVVLVIVVYWRWRRTSS